MCELIGDSDAENTKKQVKYAVNRMNSFAWKHKQPIKRPEFNEVLSVNSKLDWNDNLAAIFEAKLVINRLSSSVLFYCFSRRGWHHSSGNVPIFDVLF